MGSGAGWSTNWQLEGSAVQTGPTGKIGVFRDASGNPNLFKNPTHRAWARFDSLILGVGRAQQSPRTGLFRNRRRPVQDLECHRTPSAQVRLETFNATNTPRFDAAQAAYNFNLTSGIFGAYTNTLSVPRVMQFSARYEF